MLFLDMVCGDIYLNVKMYNGMLNPENVSNCFVFDGYHSSSFQRLVLICRWRTDLK